MKKLYHSLGDRIGEEIPYIMGIVQEVENDYEGGSLPDSMRLKISDFNSALVIRHAHYRINNGERVILYAKNGFATTESSDGNFYVEGLQVLDENGQVAFQAKHLGWTVFAEESEVLEERRKSLELARSTEPTHGKDHFIKR